MTPPPAIDTDLPCAICGYNLKGLAPDANCPECGQPVLRTFTYDLTHADPAWLRRQAATLPFLGALFLLQFQSTEYLANAGFPVSEFLARILYVVAAVVAAWACFRLARPDPRFEAEQDGTYRRGLKVAALCLTGICVLNLPQFRRLNFLSENAGLTSIWALWTAALVATELLALLLVARLARRSAEASLQRHTARVRYLLPAILVLSNVNLVFDVRPFAGAYLAFAAVLYWITPVALYATLILLGRLSETLRRTAANATPTAGTRDTPPPAVPAYAEPTA